VAVTLVTTPGAANANSYCSLTEAADYHAAHPYGDAWTDADSGDDGRSKALATATRLLDEWMEWGGSAWQATQKLAWPRYGFLARHNTAQLVDWTTIPDFVKNATAEFARQLLAEDRTADSDVETQGLSSLQVGSVQLSFRDGVRQKVVPDSVAAMLSHVGTVRGASFATPLVRT
jgi:hypothetical protein